jgi:hypothetical protein
MSVILADAGLWSIKEAQGIAAQVFSTKRLGIGM